MAENIREASEKIGTAYKMKADHPQEAMWYKDMALMHLNFNTKAHELVATQITNYRNSAEYREHPEYADGMMAVWNDRHSDLVAEAARVKSMIDALK